MQKCLSAKNRFYNFIFCIHDFHPLSPEQHLQAGVCLCSFLAKMNISLSHRKSYLRLLPTSVWNRPDLMPQAEHQTKEKIQSVTHKFTDAYKIHSVLSAKWKKDVSQSKKKKKKFTTTDSHPIFIYFKRFLWIVCINRMPKWMLFHFDRL